MDAIITPILKDDTVNKTEIEQVVRQKQEYTLLGKYNLSKGFKLFCYNPVSGKLTQPIIKKGDFIQCALIKFPDGDQNGEWVWFDPENFNITIDSRNIYFEALNMNFAENRIKKWKEGKINELFNLKKPCKGSIDIFTSL